jgi:hypothetical protein
MNIKVYVNKYGIGYSKPYTGDCKHTTSWNTTPQTHTKQDLGCIVFTKTPKHIHLISSTIDIKHKRQRPAPRTREMDTSSTTYNKALWLLHLMHGPRTPWMGTLSTNMHSNKGP